MIKILAQLQKFAADCFGLPVEDKDPHLKRLARETLRLALEDEATRRRHEQTAKMLRSALH